MQNQNYDWKFHLEAVGYQLDVNLDRLAACGPNGLENAAGFSARLQSIKARLDDVLDEITSLHETLSRESGETTTLTCTLTHAHTHMHMLMHMHTHTQH